MVGQDHLVVGSSLSQRALRVLVSSKYTNIKPFGEECWSRSKQLRKRQMTVGKSKVDISVKIGTQIVYSKYTGTELEFNGSKHLILKDDDIVVQVAEAEEKNTPSLLLTEATKEKLSIGTVIAVGPGPLDEEGNRKPLSLAPGSIVMYSNYAGNEFKGKDGYDYITLRVSDVMAVLS
nr:20 kda chaperonin, chloroplastic [Quercus suber]